jgi:hypothetical protein
MLSLTELFSILDYELLVLHYLNMKDSTVFAGVEVCGI